MWKFQKSRQYQKLEKAIAPCTRFEHTQDALLSETEAKRTLLSFFSIYATLSPETKAPDPGKEQLPRMGYYTVFLRILPIFNALCYGHYREACRELYSLYSYEDLLQNRVYTALMLLYHKFLEE